MLVAMPDPESLELARHIDRTRRRMVACRPGIVIADVLDGWMSFQPGAPPGDVPSASADRLYWFSRESVLTQDHIESGHAAARKLGAETVFVWIAPWSWSARLEPLLTAAGMNPWPVVEYLALARPSGDCPLPRPTDITVRLLSRDEAPAVLEKAAPWYGKAGVDTTLTMLSKDTLEVHAGFGPESAPDEPVALALLVPDGTHAYLSAAATEARSRGRGAQAALICSRVRRASEIGARVCSCETNSAVAVSLRNLQRCGFSRRIAWRVYRWSLAG